MHTTTDRPQRSATLARETVLQSMHTLVLGIMHNIIITLGGVYTLARVEYYAYYVARTPITLVLLLVEYYYSRSMYCMDS